MVVQHKGNTRRQKKGTHKGKACGTGHGMCTNEENGVAGEGHGYGLGKGLCVGAQKVQNGRVKKYGRQGMGQCQHKVVGRGMGYVRRHGRLEIPR